jgi:outer membrane protein
MAETLSDAIALAYESNPTVRAARANQRAIDEEYPHAGDDSSVKLGAEEET